MTAIVWPSVTNDSGTLQDGTIIDKAFLDSIESGINALAHSAANPTVTPVNVIDEVVTARGTQASVAARLNVEHNTDGTHNLAATVVTTSVLAGSLGDKNLFANPEFYMWPDGDTSAPAFYVLSGNGAAILRCGTSLSDTRRLIGDFCARVTYGSATARLQQTVLDAAIWPAVDHIEGTKVSLSAWVYSSTVSQVRAYVYTGATAGYEYSSYHTGVAGWERLEVTETVLSTATELSFGVEISGTGDFYVSGMTPILGDTPSDKFIPPQIVRGAIVFPLGSAPTIGDGKATFMPRRHLCITDVQLFAGTAPTGSFTVDVEVGDGTSWASIFASTLSILTTKEFGWKAADHATFANRFVKPAFLDNADNGAAGADQAIVRINIDAVNSAANVTAQIRAWQYVRPLEVFLAHDD